MTHEELLRLADDVLAFELRMRNVADNKALSPSMRVGALRAQVGLKDLVKALHGDISLTAPRLEV